MTSVTLLGASGGCGVTTLAALSVLLLAEQGARIPTVVAEDIQAFDRRLGTLPPTARPSGRELVDAGRYASRKAAAALSQGRLVLVGARGPRGEDAVELTLRDINERFGAQGTGRTTTVFCAAFGSGGRTDRRDDVTVPFDPRLAPGGELSLALPRLKASTRTALRSQWIPVLSGLLEAP